MSRKNFLPDWALNEEKYEPADDRDIFISRSILRVTGILFKIQSQSIKNYRKIFSAGASLIFTLLIIILCACSHKKEFLLIIFVAELVILCLLDGKEIVNILRKSLAASFFGGILILPAIFLYGATTVILLPAKTFLTVTAMQFVTEFFLWNQITSAMRLIHIPDLIIFILDTSIKYIFVLGRLAQDLLTSLKLRSVGKNLQKEKSVSGILGVTFLKSREMSLEMYQAMICRCYTGEYSMINSEKFCAADLILAFIGAIFTALFIIIEGVLN